MWKLGHLPRLGHGDQLEWAPHFPKAVVQIETGPEGQGPCPVCVHPQRVCRYGKIEILEQKSPPAMPVLLGR